MKLELWVRTTDNGDGSHNTDYWTDYDKAEDQNERDMGEYGNAAEGLWRQNFEIVDGKLIAVDYHGKSIMDPEEFFDNG